MDPEPDLDPRPAPTGPPLAPVDSRILARALEDAVVLTARDGAVRFASDAVVALLGGPDRFEQAWAWIDASLRSSLEGRAGHEGLGVDYALPAAFGGRTVRLHVFALDDGEHAHLAVVKDLRSLDALLRTMRLASFLRQHVQFLQQAAHDLKAPLNSLALNVELLRGDLRASAGDEAEARLDVIAQEIRRFDRMVQAALANARLPGDSVRRFDLRGVVREVAALILPQARSQQVRPQVALPDERLVVRGARDHLKQALVNLVVNGLEAMPGGGVLAIDVRRRPPDRVEVAIRDSGPGIPAAIRSQLFELHFTTKPQGSGLGLYTSRTSVQAMGGEVTLQCREGEGTTARVLLPLHGRTQA